MMENEQRKKREKMTSFPIVSETLIKAMGGEIKQVTCVCDKCGSSLSGKLAVQDMGGYFRPISPKVGGMEASMTLHHKETREEGLDGEHDSFHISGEINGTVHVSGQGCSAVNPL